jgi:uncharacterized circularly permuted ATP-grasp superfamily protein/uncharacterized alpha-E superfamily protein
MEGSDSIFGHYFADRSSYDELLGAGGKVRPHWETFFHSYRQLGGGNGASRGGDGGSGGEEVSRRNEDMMRLLKENGVTYNIYGEPSGMNRPWKLDIIPFLIDRNEWQGIESGLLQRARLLDLVLADIYGERRLIKSGILPAELIYNHSGFIRPCAGIRPPGVHSLILYSADLARSKEGRIWVVGDRTQAPSGSGYALENRTAMTRVVPELFSGLPVRHLSPYFNALRSGLNEIAPHQNQNPRIVILTPGSNNETYFEHAYLSSYLGFTLVQGNDLIVKDNHVWLKTMGGLERVDVILRRVDDIYCDPLELKEDSQLGIPGLLQCVRSGNVSIANPIGSGILENPGLMPFLQQAARYFLAEDLLIPTIASWWCGQPKEQQYVLANLPSLVIKRIYRNPTGSSSVDGGSLSAAQLSELRQRIMAQPTLYVGQEKVDISHTPSLVGGKIESRKVLFRGFLVAGREGYTAMTGGLCRTSAEAGNFIISNQSGGISKDAWILSPEPGRILTVLKETPERTAVTSGDTLPSHAAENLFWVGRYTERVLGNARFLRTVMQFVAEGNKLATENNRQTERCLLMALTQYSYTYPGFIGPASEALLADPWKELREVLFNEKRAGSLKYNFLQFYKAVHEVREHWSTDTWRVLRAIEEEFRLEFGLSHHDRLQMQHTLDDVITSVVAFIGLNRESISREQGWIMLDAGRKIEQSMLLITLLRTMMVIKWSEQVEYNLLQSVLMSNEGLVNYRYKYRMAIEHSLVLDLLLFDPNNPRSLTYQVDRLKAYLKNLPKKVEVSEYERLIIEADDLLKRVDKNELAMPDEDGVAYTGLDKFLTEMYGLLSGIPGVISKTYFKHEQVPKTLISRG